MKRLLVFLVTIILILSTTSVALAVVEVGGDARFWFESNIDGNDTSSFVFERFAVFMNADFSENNGFKSEIRFFNTGINNAVEHAYYYQKNLFTTDELNIGFLPLYQYYNQNTISLVGNLAYRISPPNTSPGVKYSLKSDKLEACFAILNANDQDFQNDANVNGYEQLLRIVFQPSNNLTVGAGYLNDKGCVGNTNNNGQDTFLTLDLTYQINPFSLYMEYDSETPYGASAQSGIYFEGTYKLKDNLIGYLGGTSASKSSGLLPSEYFCVGVKTQMATQTELQAEYLIYQDTADNNSLNVRLKLSF